MDGDGERVRVRKRERELNLSILIIGLIVPIPFRPASHMPAPMGQRRPAAVHHTVRALRTSSLGIASWCTVVLRGVDGLGVMAIQVRQPFVYEKEQAGYAGHAVYAWCKLGI